MSQHSASNPFRWKYSETALTLPEAIGWKDTSLPTHVALGFRTGTWAPPMSLWARWSPLWPYVWPTHTFSGRDSHRHNFETSPPSTVFFFFLLAPISLRTHASCFLFSRPYFQLAVIYLSTNLWRYFLMDYTYLTLRCCILIGLLREKTSLTLQGINPKQWKGCWIELEQDFVVKRP